VTPRMVRSPVTVKCSLLPSTLVLLKVTSVYLGASAAHAPSVRHEGRAIARPSWVFDAIRRVGAPLGSPTAWRPFEVPIAFAHSRGTEHGSQAVA
jgi:hypothetical protein